MVPHDERLPGLSVLLNSETVKGILESQIHGTNERILDCRVDYMRYWPGRSCKATYVITTRNEVSGRTEEHIWYGKCLTREAFPKAHEQAMARVWTKPAIGSPFTAVPEHQIILFAYPNDRCLEGLTTVNDESALRQLLELHNSGRDFFSDGRLVTTLLRYKPEQRAVFRCQIECPSSERSTPSGTTVYLKIYSDGGARKALDMVVRLLWFFGPEPTLAFPEPLVFAADQNMLICGSAPGVTLGSFLGSPDQCQAFARVGEALAKLHAYDDPKLPRVPLADWLDKIQQDIDLLRQFVPRLNGQLREISQRLRMRTPRIHECVFGFVFADCNPGNLFVDSRRIGFIDFDRAHMGCSMADIGRMLAWLRNWRLRGRLADDVPLREAFLQAYMRAAKTSLNSEVVGWWIAVMLLQTALKPARRLKSDQSQVVEMLLQEVAQTLQ